MERYLEQLLEEIKAAEGRIPPPDEPYPDCLIDKERYPFPYLYEWENHRTPQLSELLGLEKTQFPPAERLSAPQMQAIIDAMFELWAVFNLYPEIPEGIPLDLLYTVVVNELDEYHDYIPEEKTEIDFCSYNCELCQLGKYCHCEEDNSYEEWLATPESEKQAFLDDFHAKIADNLAKGFQPKEDTDKDL